MLTALREALDAGDPPPGLAEAVARLTARYRAGVADAAPAVRSALERAAYLATRMPATASAVATALRAGRARSHGAWTSLLDLGSGPGSALWAAVEVLDGLERLTAFERDDGLIAEGRRLAARGPLPLPATDWRQGDLRALPELPRHDLVTLSYALGELAPAEQDLLVDAAWSLAEAAFAIVEPGTPRGAETILRARARLIAHGAAIAAPCPHARACPLAGGVRDDRPRAGAAPGWCHFSVRLPRSRLHRAAKTAALGFEDEPFSYLVVCRETLTVSGGRVVAPPHAHKGGVAYVACARDGLRAVALTRRDPAWKPARHLAWGDWVPPAPDGTTDAERPA